MDDKTSWSALSGFPPGLARKFVLRYRKWQRNNVKERCLVDKPGPAAPPVVATVSNLMIDELKAQSKVLLNRKLFLVVIYVVTPRSHIYL